MITCPKCAEPMERVKFEETTVDRCRGCAGIWFDALELKAVVKARGGKKLDVGNATHGKHMDDTNRIDCPHCKTQMLRLIDDRHRKVRYEQCSVCGGAYLDAGELRVIETRTVGEMLDLLFEWS